MSTIEAPAADLSGRIDFFWSTPTTRAERSRFREFLPDCGTHLVFRLSGSSARVSLLGPATEKACVELDPDAAYLGLRFRPGAAPRLVDARGSELANAHAEVTRIAGRRVESISDELRSLPDLASRRALLEDLVRRSTAPLVRDERCRAAARLLEVHGGRLRVDDLSRALGVTARTLERAFVRELGVAPKRLIRLVRLRQVLGTLREGRFRTLAEVAYACGFADQSHLIRDFKALTGRAPGERDAFRTRALAAETTRIVHHRRA